MARNHRNQVYGWGLNKHNIFLHDEIKIFKPHKINYIDDKNIVDTCCGYCMCMALSSESIIYNWRRRYNIEDEHGNSKIFTPTIIIANEMMRNKEVFLPSKNVYDFAENLYNGRAMMEKYKQLERKFKM